MATPLGSGRPGPGMDEMLNTMIRIAEHQASTAEQVARREARRYANRVEQLCTAVMETGAFARDIEVRVWTDGFVEVA